MNARVPIAIACGLAAALCNLAPQSGFPGGLMLSLVTSLPLFYAGLTQSWLWALVAGLVATGVMLAFGGGWMALIFLAATAMPVIVLVRQALLAQPLQDGGLIWYPVDRLAWWLGGIGLLFGLGVFMVMETGPFRETVDQVFQAVFATAEMSETDLARFQEMFRRIIPPVFAGSTMLLLVFNGALAQWIARRSGRAVRAELPLAGLRLPMAAAVALAAASLGSAVIPGDAGLLLAIAAAVLSTLFVLQGLAVAHRLIGSRTGGGGGLAIFYVVALIMLFVLTPLVILMLMLLGVADCFLDLRRRNTSGTGT
jgi:hypothetical protein